MTYGELLAAYHDTARIRCITPLPSGMYLVDFYGEYIEIDGRYITTCDPFYLTPEGQKAEATTPLQKGWIHYNTHTSDPLILKVT